LRSFGNDSCYFRPLSSGRHHGLPDLHSMTRSCPWSGLTCTPINHSILRIPLCSKRSFHFQYTINSLLACLCLP
jgi:hypothetical protein